MNNIELINIAMEFLPKNSKITNIKGSNDSFRTEVVDEIIVEYLFRAGEYTMVLGEDFGKWYVKEVYDSYKSNENNEMRYEKKPIVVSPIQTAIKVVPKEKLFDGVKSITIPSSNPNFGSLNSTGTIPNFGSLDNNLPNDPNLNGYSTSEQGNKNSGVVGSKVGSGSGLTKDKKKILSCVEGDATGSGKLLRICIVADQYQDNDKLAQSLYLEIEGVSSNFKSTIKLDVDYGYDPHIGLYDFTGNGVYDILISMRSGGSGGYYFYYIYSYINNKFIKIFDWQAFNKKSKFKVTYLDYKKVEVSGGLMNSTYIIDISQRDKLYLESLYDKSCKLKNQLTGSVSGVVNLYPVSINNNRKFELHVICNIIGAVADDILGGVVYIAKWDGKQFATLGERVILFGNTTYDNYGLSKIDPDYVFLPGQVPD